MPFFLKVGEKAPVLSLTGQFVPLSGLGYPTAGKGKG